MKCGWKAHKVNGEKDADKGGWWLHDSKLVYLCPKCAGKWWLERLKEGK